MEIILNIAIDFSETPGARYRSDGPFSGEEFYEDKLKEYFEKAVASKSILKIILDGTEGYATSFLDEAFGRLAHDFGVKVVKDNTIIVSEEEPDLLEEINGYIEDAHK